jgi:hypothetical protein
MINEHLVRAIAISATISCVLTVLVFWAYLEIYHWTTGGFLHLSDKGPAAVGSKFLLSLAASSGIIAAFSFIVNYLGV